MILDTKACVSCVDESLVSHRMDSVRPVQGVYMNTATDEPVHIVGRTDITLVISKCVLRFSVFVARGVGDCCCILGNGFHLQFNTQVDFQSRSARFITQSGRHIASKFSSQARDTKYLGPLPNPAWLNQIQLGECQNKRTKVLCANSTAIPPRSLNPNG